MFIQNITTKPERKTDDGNTIRIVLPFNHQTAANVVRRQLRDLSNKIAVTLQPIFVSKKLVQDLKPKEIKPSIVSQHCFVYKFAYDMCSCRLCWLHSPTPSSVNTSSEHKYSAIGKHFLEAHGDKNRLNDGQFRVHKKCHGKFDCLIYDMLLIPQVKKKQETIILLFLCNYPA